MYINRKLLFLHHLDVCIFRNDFLGHLLSFVRFFYDNLTSRLRMCSSNIQGNVDITDSQLRMLWDRMKFNCVRLLVVQSEIMCPINRKRGVFNSSYHIQSQLELQNLYSDGWMCGTGTPLFSSCFIFIKPNGESHNFDLRDDLPGGGLSAPSFY